MTRGTSMKRWLLGLFCLVLSSAVTAAGTSKVRERAVGSMLVTGWIDVGPTGKVVHFDLDQPSKLPPMVIQLIGQTLPGWMFEPVEVAGKPVIAKARMSLRVIAEPVGSGRYQIRLVGADFGVPDGKSTLATDELREKLVTAPQYPATFAGGTVYVLMMINRQGRVEQAFAQQVNLRVVASDAQMRAFRDSLSRASISAALHWTFIPPTTGSEAGEPYWLARIPISFERYGEKPVAYGRWDVYIPGPVQSAPWLHQMPTIANDKLIVAHVDSTPPEGDLSLTNGLRLITRLDGS